LAELPAGLGLRQLSGVFDSSPVMRKAAEDCRTSRNYGAWHKFLAFAQRTDSDRRALLECRLYCQSVGKRVLVPAVEVTWEKNLLNALTDLDVAVKAMPSANPKLNLLKLFARIEELAKQLPGDTDPTLLHYLRKKSYQKARLFLQGRDAENQAGNCQHLN
jgi:hypothetical protein